MPNNVPPADDRQPALERRLATIMMADVAGYSRMMGENEERTVQMLRGHREVFDALLGLHRGRIFNTAGDAILAEFPSAVEAVRCATEIQSALRTRNEHFPEDERMWFRIGINLGDVIIQGTDLLGDGVNVAARIQTVAQPGGVCISGSVYDQIQNKLTLQFTMLGERSFKNIAQPIRTFSISEADGTAMPATATAPPRPKQGWKLVGILALLGALVLAAGSGYWLYRGHETLRTEELRQTIEKARQATETERLAADAQTAKAAQDKTAAEEAQRKAKEAQLAAETSQHQARLEAEAQATKAALERAKVEKKRLDQELKRAETEKLAIDAAPPDKAAAKAHLEETPKLMEPARPASTPTAMPPAKAVEPTDPFDGTYEGSLCNDRSFSSSDKKCWPLFLKVEHGVASGKWTNPAGRQGHVRGTIFPDGTVAITLDAWQPSGKPTDASLTGKWENNMISVSGKWKEGLPVTGDWTRGH